MAQSKTATTSKTEDSAAKAYADAAAQVKPAKAKPLVDSLKADAAENTAKTVEAKKVAPKAAQATPAVKAEAPAKEASAKKVASKKVAPKKVAAKKAPAEKVVAKKVAAKKVAAKKSAAAKKPVASKPAAKQAAPTKKTAAKPVTKAPAAKTKPTVTQLKEKIMATKTADFTNVMTDTMSDAVNELQARAQSAYDKSAEAMTEATEFAKGNVEAVVESGKVFAEGVQTLGQTYADEAKSAYETATADLQEMASIKSPTELFQLQGKILRRNFDALVATASKNTDAAMKLANDAAAPISGRVNVAAEKLSKVA